MSAYRERNVHGILGFVIVLLGLSILLAFSQYKENIIESGNFQLFVILTSIGLALLLYLFFLGGEVNQHKNLKKTSSRKKK